MWSSRLFWRLFLTYAVLNFAAAIAFVVVVSGWQEDQVVEQVNQRLFTAAALLRSDVVEQLPKGATAKLQTQVQNLGNEISARITLASMEGRVLADSEKNDLQEVAAMENHKTRPELVRAAARGRGVSQRTSPTLGIRMLYLALRADLEGEPVGMVRIALPMESIQQEVASIRRLIWLVAISVSLLVLVLTYGAIGRIIRPILELTQAAKAMSAGEAHQNIPCTGKDELGLLAQAFNAMSRKHTAQVDRLSQSKGRLSTVLEGMEEGVIAVDSEKRILFANPAAAAMLDFSLASAEGQALVETVRNLALHQVADEAFDKRTSQRREIEIVGENNRLINVNATPLQGEPCPGVVLVLYDATELRRLEFLRREFAANVSHELKTPLTAIKAYAETLRNGAIDDPQNNLVFVARIEEQAERLHQLILDLLSLSRIESGEKTFDITKINLGNAVESCLSEYQATATAKNIQLQSDLGGEPLFVKADEEGLREILNNLVDNAIKYTPAGGAVKVRCRLEKQMAVIEVDDTGIGIPGEDQARIFERFYRVDKARSRELGGTGLGLSIVKHLCQAFGGGVEVQSRPGQGTKFTVRLPSKM